MQIIGILETENYLLIESSPIRDVNTTDPINACVQLYANEYKLIPIFKSKSWFDIDFERSIGQELSISIDIDKILFLNIYVDPGCTLKIKMTLFSSNSESEISLTCNVQVVFTAELILELEKTVQKSIDLFLYEYPFSFPLFGIPIPGRFYIKLTFDNILAPASELK